MPGVKELFEKKEASGKVRSRAELYEGIDSDYYGFHDDDDGKLIAIEEQFEKEARQTIIADVNKALEFRKQKTNIEGVVVDTSLVSQEERQGFSAFVDVPTLEQVEQLLVQKRKEQLLKRLSAY